MKQLFFQRKQIKTFFVGNLRVWISINIHLDFIVASDDTKRDILLNSGDYPEIFLSGAFSNLDVMKYGVDQQIFIPLNDLIDEYAVELKRAFNEVPTMKGDMIAPDGNIAKTIDRSELFEAQTPQVFKPEIIRQAYQNIDKIKEDITDDAQLVEALGKPVKIVPGDSGNIKITTKTDLAIAGAILKARPKPKPTGPAGPWAAEQGW